MKFQDLGISESTLNALHRMGFETPTPIQAEATPILLQGEDLIGQAQTGTGKTAAFGIAIAESIEGKGLQSLILCPTRELATQVADELNAIGDGGPLKAVAVYGGVGFGGQNAALKNRNTTCIVATPGRLMDHMERGTVDFSGVGVVVIDEADRMFDMGFLPAVERILKALPPKRQTALFSATMPDAVKKLANRHLHKPEFVRTGEDSLTTPLAKLYRVSAPKSEKLAHTYALLEEEKPGRAVIFTRTRHGARRLTRKLARAGYEVGSLHGDMSQKQRDASIDGFKNGRLRLLVATDVASRGLDIEGVTHVLQYDVPHEPEVFVHRVGRTGRAGANGRTFLLVDREEEADVRQIEKLIESTLEPFQVTVTEAHREQALPGGPDRTPRGKGGPQPQQRFVKGKPNERFDKGEARRQTRRRGSGGGGPRRGGPTSGGGGGSGGRRSGGPPRRRDYSFGPSRGDGGQFSRR